MNKEYKTVEKYAQAEIIIEKSRFIGYVKPVNTVEEAETFITSIRTMNKDATHNVPVYLIGQCYEIQKYSDDGEPSGTAGIPVLDMLKKEKITNLAMVITRYFGGIKLGTGGLVRAYTSAAKLALERASVIRKVKHELVEVKINYSFLGKVQSDLLNDGYIIKDIVFLEDVTIYIYAREESKQQLINLLVNITSGQCKIQELGSEYLNLKI